MPRSRGFGAELAIRTAETVDAATYAKAQYAAASNMLQQAHKEFDAGHWDAVRAGTTLARTEATRTLELSRPRYELAAAATHKSARDRALEEDATAISGVMTRLERDGDLQRLVLVLSGLFPAKRSTLVPEGAKVLDSVKDLLVKYGTYPFGRPPARMLSAEVVSCEVPTTRVGNAGDNNASIRRRLLASPCSFGKLPIARRSVPKTNARERARRHGGPSGRATCAARRHGSCKEKVQNDDDSQHGL